MRLQWLPKTKRQWLRAGAVALATLLLAAGAMGFLIKMPGQSYKGPLAPLTPEQAALRERLREHVRVLAGEIGERNTLGYDALTSSAKYIEGVFKEMGYEPARQEFEVEKRAVWNVEARLPGAGKAEEIVVIGAHYDSAIGTPGANDNASAVAAMLELARAFCGAPAARNLRFVAFVNEEPPYFQTDGMGSLRYARRCRRDGDRIAGMMALETIGYYSDAPKSQLYPPIVGNLYPSTGNFIAFVGNIGSRAWVQKCIGAFRRAASFPSEGAALYGEIEGVGWSDHWSFWQSGYPALMVTDTAPFRYPFYHTSEDTPDKIDYDKLARVVAGLEAALREMAEESLFAPAR